MRSLVALALLFSVLFAASIVSSNPDDLIASVASSNPDERIVRTDGDGVVRFFGVLTDEAPKELKVSGSTASDPKALSDGFLSKNGAVFGLSDGAGLNLLSQSRSGSREVFKYQVVYGGVPVFASQVIVNVKGGSISSVSSSAGPSLALDVEPTYSKKEALTEALSIFSKHNNVSSDGLETSYLGLMVFDPSVVDGFSGDPSICHVFEVVGDGVGDKMFVDAHSLAVVAEFPLFLASLNREIYDGEGDSQVSTFSNLVRSEGQAATGITDVDNAYDFLEDTWSFYMNHHGYDSIDGLGLTLKAGVRDTSAAGNAYYSSTYKRITHGVDMLTDDILAHEYTHGVTDYNSNLVYSYQSGAMNEGFSDIWGEFIDMTNGAGTDGAQYDWLMGEGCYLGVIRSAKDPTAYGDPDSIHSSYYYCGSSDYGGVHTNSGVASKAAYLIAAGDDFNGYRIEGIGINKTASIFWDAQANLLTSSATYPDLFAALVQASFNQNLSAHERAQVKKALYATEMNDTPCLGSPASISCVSQTLLEDGMDSPGDWESAVENGSSTWSFSYKPASSAWVMFATDIATTSKSSLALSQPVSIPVGYQSYMLFNHTHNLEGSSTCYDGGVVEYSTDGAGTWDNLDSLMISNAGNGVVSSSYSNPLGGETAFCFDSSGYKTTVVNLTSLAGEDVNVRFTLGTDYIGADWGWEIDYLKFYICNGTGNFSISSCTQLQDMWDNLTADYVLASDVNCTESKFLDYDSGFLPVGNSTHNFTGSFDGANHTIWGLFINRSSMDNVGLFGVLDSSAYIRDVYLSSVNITGSDRVGGLVGWGVLSNIQDVHVSGEVTSTGSEAGCVAGRLEHSPVYQSSASCAVASDVSRAGGVAGYFLGNSSKNISQSKSSGSVSCVSFFCGGLVGLLQDGLIEDSYSIASVTAGLYAGGLAAESVDDAQIVDSYSAGAIDASGYCGGLVATNEGGISGSFFAGSLSCPSNAGGLVGEYSSGTISGSYWDRSGSNPDVMCGTASCSDSYYVEDDSDYWFEFNNPPMDGWAFGSNWYGNLTYYPMLYWEKGKTVFDPTLTQYSVSPELGESGTFFNFTVRYRDLDDQAPSYMDLMLSGAEKPMQAGGASYSRGVLYYYNLTLSEVGTYSHRFNASDGGSEETTQVVHNPRVYDTSPSCSGASLGQDFDIDTYTSCSSTAFLVARNLRVLSGNMLNLSQTYSYVNGSNVPVDGGIILDGSVLDFV